MKRRVIIIDITDKKAEDIDFLVQAVKCFGWKCTKKYIYVKKK